MIYENSGLVPSLWFRLNMSFLSRRLKLLAEYERKLSLLSSKPIIGTFVCSAYKPFSGGPDRIIEAEKEYLQQNSLLFVMIKFLVHNNQT